MLKPFFILLALLLAGCGQPRQRLNILVYPQFLDPRIVAEFEQQFDCKVTSDYVDTPEILNAKLAGGGDGLYDVVLVLSDALPSLGRRGFAGPSASREHSEFQKC